MAGKIRVIKLADFGVSSYCHVKHQGLQMMLCGMSILMHKFQSPPTADSCQMVGV